MLPRLFLLSLVLIGAEASAQTTTARPQPQTPLPISGAPTEEPRFQGTDSPSWLIVQAIGTTSEALRHSGTGAPVCINYNAIVSFTSDQPTCFCFTQDPNVRVSAPTADGTCVIADDYGRDGTGSCLSLSANERLWQFPAYDIVSTRPGARGYPTIAGGLCTVATSTTNSFGASDQRVPCRVTADCTTVVGSGTCEDTTAWLDSQRRDVQAKSCAYVVTAASAAAIAKVGGKR